MKAQLTRERTAPTSRPLIALEQIRRMRGGRVYENVRSIDAFEPWLTLVEQMDEEALATAADGIPNGWYADNDALRNLLDQLYAQRNKVRESLFSLRNLRRDLFPNWIDGAC